MASLLFSSFHLDWNVLVSLHLEWLVLCQNDLVILIKTQMGSQQLFGRSWHIYNTRLVFYLYLIVWHKVFELDYSLIQLRLYCYLNMDDIAHLNTWDNISIEHLWFHLNICKLHLLFFCYQTSKLSKNRPDWQWNIYRSIH